MDKEELLKYEMPTIAEFVSIDCLQTLLAIYLSWKINRKLHRYYKRKDREEFIKKVLLKSNP